MLQKLNERIQGIVAWVVIILIGITFTLFGVDYYLQGRRTTNFKVIVNNHPLTEQVFETNYRRSRSMQDFAQMTAADEKELQNQVLEQMIMNEVLVQSAERNGFNVGPNQANAAILNIPQFQEDGHFSSQRYQQALNAALFTPETFQTEVKQGMLLNQQRFAFMGTSFALPDEVERFVSLYLQTRDYDYLTIPASRFIKAIEVPSAAIMAYYKAHKKEFNMPEQVSLDYVILSMRDMKQKINVTHEEVTHYYEENKSNYLTPARWRVAHILFAIPADSSKTNQQEIQKKANHYHKLLQKNPQEFDQLVATVSDDKLSLADKGLLPWITAGQNDYANILSDLIKPGAISAPKKTKYGYELFKLIDYKPVRIKPLTEVAAAIKDQLLTETAQSQYAQSLEQLSDLSYQTPDSLNSVADALKLKIKKTSLFSRLAGTDKLTQNKEVIHAAFSHDVLDLGNNSVPIQLDSDSVVVLRVNQHIPEKELSLDAVRDQINKILLKKLAESRAKEIAMSLLNADRDKKKQEALIRANQLAWTRVTDAGRDNEKQDVLINDLAFNLLKVGSLDTVVLPNGDHVVVRLKHINNGRLTILDSEQQDSLVQQIEASYGMMDYDLYIRSLMNSAKIKRI